MSLFPGAPRRYFSGKEAFARALSLRPVRLGRLHPQSRRLAELVAAVSTRADLARIRFKRLRGTHPPLEAGNEVSCLLISPNETFQAMSGREDGAELPTLAVAM
jgi:hypothetical protein